MDIMRYWNSAAIAIMEDTTYSKYEKGWENAG